MLSASQLATLAELGEERTAAVGGVLYRVGDRRYPFIAIIEGEAAILDAAGNEVVRHGASGFLGELNLLTGQTVYLTAIVTRAMRYIAVDRDALRPLLFEDGPLSDLLLSTFMARREALQRVQGIGIEVIGPHSSAATTRMVEFARGNRLPYTWHEPRRPIVPSRSSPASRVTSCGWRMTGRSQRARCSSRPARSTGGSRSTASRTTKG